MNEINVEIGLTATETYVCVFYVEPDAISIDAPVIDRMMYYRMHR